MVLAVAPYCSSQDVLTMLAGTPINMSGAFRGALIGKIPQITADLNRRVRLERGQRPSWSFLPPALYEAQLVAFAGTPTAGSWQLVAGAVATAAIDWDADSTDVQSAIDTAFGAGAIAVAPAVAGGPFRLTWAAAGPQELLSALASLTPTDVYVTVERLVPGATATSVARRFTAARGTRYLPIDDAMSVSQVRLLSFGAPVMTLELEQDYLPVAGDVAPIEALELVRSGTWPSAPGAVEVTLVPGCFAEVPADLQEAAIIEVMRAYLADRTGNDDKLGFGPLGQVMMSKAFTSKVDEICEAYRRGDAFLRPIRSYP